MKETRRISWHPPEVQTECFLADFFSRITADCRLPLWVWPWFEHDFCKKAFRLKRVHANHLIRVSVCLGMWLKRPPYLSGVCHSHRRSGHPLIHSVDPCGIYRKGVSLSFVRTSSSQRVWICCCRFFMCVWSSAGEMQSQLCAFCLHPRSVLGCI